ncbi:prepronociceptin-like isoform X2 [Scleropages formosus]|nr:prepronociceptin-like isoform X2 [Scleropages formosus]XP_029114461.1 prepronociceptin-like isoform X2 [Scleropages formosus]
MKTPLWTLLLLCVCDPGRCDCQRDCLSCGLLLPEKHAFSVLVCLVECESEESPALTWEPCRQSVQRSQSQSLPEGGALLKRAEEELAAPMPAEQGDGELLQPGALQRFDHVARALRTDQLSSAYRARRRGSEEEEGAETEGGASDGDLEGAVDLAKRFGGFLKGRYGYRKLMDPGRSVQKRYGGFIGVRKSARKWNNQKRFSEFLKQYLGMSTRASEFNSVSADISQQNEM